MSDDPPRVRRATAADLDGLAAMGAALARLHHELDPQRFFTDDDIEEGYRSWFARERTRGEAFLRVVDDEQGRLAGYAYGRMHGVNWADLLGAHAALVDLYVREDARGRGMGAALVEDFCAWAKEKGAPRVVLKTASRNASAQRAFARLGFRPTMVEMTRETGGGEDPGD